MASLISLRRNSPSLLAVVSVSIVFLHGSVVGNGARAAPSQKPAVSVVAVKDLIAHREKYDEKKVMVVGVLLWHADEPSLFNDRESLENLRFMQAIQLETPWGTDFSQKDRKVVEVTGTFHYLPPLDAGSPGLDYVRVTTIALVGIERRDLQP